MSILLRLRYDGTDFCGFARQEGRRTVQGELESALAALYGCPIRCRGASRTDSGVHAIAQLVAFEPPEQPHIPIDGLLRALGGFLPRDLAMWDAWEQFDPEQRPLNPRFDNGGKRYRYRIRSAPQRDPLQSRYAWELRSEIDVEAMRSAAKALIGEHDFSAFRAADCQAAHAVRRIESIHIETCAEHREDVPRYGELPSLPAQRVEIHVQGTAFLKYMVRNICGSLVLIGQGRRPIEWLAQVRDQKDRTLAGPTAPAWGLCLLEVLWPRPASAKPRALPDDSSPKKRCDS